jgi:hypothetical protein
VSSIWIPRSCHPARQALDLQVDDLADLVARQGLELDDVVEPVDELGLELGLHARASARDVRGHDHHGVLEVDRATWPSSADRRPSPEAGR